MWKRQGGGEERKEEKADRAHTRGGDGKLSEKKKRRYRIRSVPNTHEPHHTTASGTLRENGENKFR